MRVLLCAIMLLASSCSVRVLALLETEDAVNGKMNLQKDQENEKIIISPSLPSSNNSI